MRVDCSLAAQIEARRSSPFSRWPEKSPAPSAPRRIAASDVFARHVGLVELVRLEIELIDHVLRLERKDAPGEQKCGREGRRCEAVLHQGFLPPIRRLKVCTSPEVQCQRLIVQPGYSRASGRNAAAHRPCSGLRPRRPQGECGSLCRRWGRRQAG